MQAAARSTAVKNILGYSTGNGKLKHLEPHFSTFSDEVRLQGGQGNRCRFATLTGVHQGAHICLAKLWFTGKVRS